MELGSKPARQGMPEPPAQGGSLAYARAWPRLFVFLLLLAFVAQGTVVQSHVHFIEYAHPVATAYGHSRIEAPPAGKGSSPADCPLCQEAAMAGAYVLPAVLVVPPPPAPLPWTSAAAFAAFTLSVPALGWLSRAPPE